jgi:tetratricopeptide (TPR) repeat protein
LNEWRQAGWRVKAEEHVIDPLTDPEINRLLRFLEKNNSLGQLRDLEEGLRIAAIKEKHGKELLVTMRETTEGASFDAILEDEYLGIKNPKSRELYLTVACFHQHDALARDTILADLLKLPVEEMYALCRDSTEGVVVFDCVDQSYGHYAARTRHRVIAQVLWERCGSGAERDRLVLSVLGAINLTYRLDREAFDQFIRSDRLVDTIRTFEGKTQFFETAVKKDPENPYVLQHYARMLLREKKAELALGQISLALKLNSASRVLPHTRAVILRDLALETPSAEIARKRLAQSEEEFRQCISIHNRDQYAFQGLAELYLGWAKRAQTAEEATAYIGKAEEAIEDGLRQVKVRDGLWLVSSDVQKWLGDQPRHIQALEKAVAENPGSIIAPYLLGRAYRKSGKTQQARDVLHKLVTNNPNAFRPCVEYAYVLWEIGEPYSKSIAVLRLSSLYGLSDPRFVATLGGMLFMSEKFTEAHEVFAESIKHEFPAVEARRIEFRPSDSLNRNKPLSLFGNIVTVRPGYAFIQVPGYPNFICPASKFGGLPIKPGLKVAFEPAFSARGAMADNLRQA